MEIMGGSDHDNFDCANKIERFKGALEKCVNKERASVQDNGNYGKRRYFK